MLHGLVRHVDSIDRCESPVWSAGQVAVQLRKLQFTLIMVYLYLSLSCRDPANALVVQPGQLSAPEPSPRNATFFTLH